MTSPEKGHTPEDQKGLDAVNTTARLNQSASVSGGVQDYVTGLLNYMDEWWVDMTGVEWKELIENILKEVSENPAKYKRFKLTIQTRENYQKQDSSLGDITGTEGVNDAARAIMAELRKMRYIHSDYDICIISIELMEQ